MDKNLTLLQFRQYTQDALKMIPVQQKIIYIFNIYINIAKSAL